MKLHAFHTGGEIAPWSLIDPFHPKVGETFTVPFHVFLIEHDQGLVLFDLGAHPDLAHDPRARLGAAADDFDVRLDARGRHHPAAGGLGVKPDDIDIVVLSTCTTTTAAASSSSREARFLVQETELRFAHWPGVYQRSVYVKADFDHPVRWRELRGTHDVFGDGRLVLHPTPGHTPGHQSLFVGLDEHPLVLCADAAYTAYNMENRALPGIVWSADAMVESWDLLEDLADRHWRALIFTHDPDHRETILTAPGHVYR